MNTTRLYGILLALGIALIVLPPIWISDLESILPLFIFALLLVIYCIWRLVRARFGRQSAPPYTAVERSELRSASGEGSRASNADEADDFSPAADEELRLTETNQPAQPTLNPYLRSQPRWTAEQTAARAAQRSANTASGETGNRLLPTDGQVSTETEPLTGQIQGATEPPLPEGDEDASHGLFDIDPELLHLQVVHRMQQALLELFDVDPQPVRAALAELMKREAEQLFDTDPDALHLAIATLLEERLLELFDIDPVAVRQVIAARNEQQLSELFDVDPAQVKAAIAEMLSGSLFDTDPVEVKKILAALVESELLELFDIDPDLVKAALKLQYLGEMLELFDKDPAMLRATFSWRQADQISELFDTDPDALRALWEAAKAEPRDIEAAMQRASSLVPPQVVTAVQKQQEELLESLSQLPLSALQRRRRLRAERDEPYLGPVTLEYLRRQVALRIVEEKVERLEIQRIAVRGVILEQRLSGMQKQLLLQEISEKLTSARTLSFQLRKEARSQLAKDRLAQQEAVYRSSRRASGGLDPAATERMRQRMLERSRQTQKPKEETK